MPKNTPIWAIVLVAAIATWFGARGGLEAFAEWLVLFAIAYAVLFIVVGAGISAKYRIIGSDRSG